MPSDYPAAIDSLTNPGDTDTLDDPPHDDLHTDANDAIVATQTELGVNPRGSYSDVRARLDALDEIAIGPAQESVIVSTDGTDPLDLTLPPAARWLVVGALKVDDTSSFHDLHIGLRESGADMPIDAHRTERAEGTSAASISDSVDGDSIVVPDVLHGTDTTSRWTSLRLWITRPSGVSAPRTVIEGVFVGQPNNTSVLVARTFCMINDSNAPDALRLSGGTGFGGFVEDSELYAYPLTI